MRNVENEITTVDTTTLSRRFEAYAEAVNKMIAENEAKALTAKEDK